MVTGRKLLLADDSVTIQKVIDLTFSDEGIEVTTVGNGEQAILKLEEIQPDIVLADIFMPGRTGYEVCEHIKRDERFRHIPVLLLVGSFEPFDEAEARRVGADDYLTKPFQSIRQLVHKVTSLLGGGGSEDEASTRDLELPEELAAKEESRSNGGADIFTADTAPLSKEIETEAFKEKAAPLAGHESLDDELIEARPANPVEEEQRETKFESQTRPTEPLSFADLAETGLKPQAEEATAEAAQDKPAPFQETLRDFELNEMNEDPLSTEPQESSTASNNRYMTNAAAADEALLDLGDIEAPVAATEADDFILDLQDDPPPAPKLAIAPSTSSPWDEAPLPTGAVASAESSAPSSDDSYAHGFAQEEWRSPFEAAPSNAPESFIDEGPGPVEANTFTDEAPHAAEPQPSFEPQASQESAQAAGQITLAQLSPEAIDAIAHRAVELLSSKVVEQVAWEVVPQLAELLIKRKLEEEKTP